MKKPISKCKEKKKSEKNRYKFYRRKKVNGVFKLNRFQLYNEILRWVAVFYNDRQTQRWFIFFTMWKSPFKNFSSVLKIIFCLSSNFIPIWSKVPSSYLWRGVFLLLEILHASYDMYAIFYIFKCTVFFLSEKIEESTWCSFWNDDEIDAWQKKKTINLSKAM